LAVFTPITEIGEKQYRYSQCDLWSDLAAQKTRE